MPFGWLDHPGTGVKNTLGPGTFDKMVKYAEKLARNIPFIRIDYYEVNGHLYFG